LDNKAEPLLYAPFASTPTRVDLHVAADFPTQSLKSLCKRRNLCLSQRLVCCRTHQYADAAHAIGLLRAGGERLEAMGFSPTARLGMGASGPEIAEVAEETRP
jgi:hypothetical protein